MAHATLSQELVRAALARVATPDGDRSLADAMLWATAVDSFGSIKLEIPGVTEASALDAVAKQAVQAVRRHAAQHNIGLTGLIVEFVDHPGTVIHRHVFGSQPEEQVGGQPGSDATSGASDGAKPAQANPADAGHRPIPGLQSQQPTEAGNALPNVANIIAVGAGKGGVGKSTIAVNLAVALARQGHAVGLMDGDIYGPSLPTMLGLDSMEQAVHDGKLQPHAVHGIKAITIGKLVDPEKPLIWRGPMAHGAFKQLTEQTAWGPLDYLIVDLPPGTGDICLTMAQTLQLTGAVVVCTPQKVAQDDAVRAVRMFGQLGIEMLGVVENMSYFIGDDGKTYDIFGRGGAEQMAQRLNVPFLGQVPINTALRTNSDSGEPSKNFEADTAGGVALPSALKGVAQQVESQANLAAMRQGRSKPTLTIS
ncbi:MAG: Mrp/NBP35 family ATP-binding protein [Planctomycetota bacterium]